MASAPPGAGGSTGMGLAGPIISGVATLGGAALGGKAAKSAAKTQAQTTDKTLAFTREQEAQRKAVYDQRMSQWTASRNALLQRYGIDIAPPSAAPAAEAKQDTSEYDSGFKIINAIHGGNVSKDQYDAFLTSKGKGNLIPKASPSPQPGPAMAQAAPQGLQGGNLAALIQPQQAPRGMPDLESWKRPNYGLPQA